MKAENRELYFKAMRRMERLGRTGESMMDFIAYQEEEIDRYRHEVEEMRKLIAAKEAEETVAHIAGRNFTETLKVEGSIELTDSGILHIACGDKLVLRTDKEMFDGDVARIAEDFYERYGIEVVLIDGRYDILGVAECRRL